MLRDISTCRAVGCCVQSQAPTRRRRFYSRACAQRNRRWERTPAGREAVAARERLRVEREAAALARLLVWGSPRQRHRRAVA